MRKKTAVVDKKELYRRAMRDAVIKLDSRHLVRNPVMFVVEVGSLLLTALFVVSLFGVDAVGAPASADSPAFIAAIAVWLWFTVLFANFAEALAEGRGKAQAEALRRTRTETPAKKLAAADPQAQVTMITSTELRKGDWVLVEANDIIPADGTVVMGIAAVNESAVTGESAPVIRESGGDRSAVTGGTRVISDWLVIEVSSNPGEGFLDRMISLVEGAKRQKTPNEIALTILLAGFAIVFLVVTATLLPFSIYSVRVAGVGAPVTITVLTALLVCLIPTTIGGLLNAIGIAGMDRLIQRNVLAMSGRAVEAAGDVDVLLLDKTGTITLGNRQATAFVPVAGVRNEELARLTQLASLSDETPEGRNIVALAEREFGLKPTAYPLDEAEFIPFTAQTRMSGVNLNGDAVRKGAPDSIIRYVHEQGGDVPASLQTAIDAIARTGGTPLVVAHNSRAIGVVHLKDVVKPDIKERFSQLRSMGIKTVMITGDNPLTATAIAAEAGVDDFLAEATPEAKLKLIRAYQAEGRLVAMTGDGTNDAPALAQADVAVAMNTGTQPAREAANMVDLDSNPTKLIEIVEIGKQLLITRGALTTFSIANDVAKYFAIISAAFAATYPALTALNFMRLVTPQSAILSAVIFNALIIIALVPLALRGVPYRPMPAARMLGKNLLIYGLGGLIAPFVGIKVIDMILAALGLV
ncbi:MAG: potassium-transporting ATPase subunit KdpB [Candidatus Promineifilaceae bacterium]